MSGTNVENLNINVVPIGVWKAPLEDARAVTLRIAAAGTYDFNTENAFNEGKFTTIQGMYIDNAASGSAVTVSIDQTSHSVTCPPNAQGYFTLIAPMPCRVKIVCAAACTVLLTNVPVVPNVWKVA